MYRVVLVDDERIIVEGLSRVLPWAQLRCQVVGTARDGQEGLALIRREQPDILLTDIRMPNIDGLTMLAALSSEYPRMQKAVLTAYRDFDYAQRAMHLGVCRYLLKPSKMDELQEALRFMTAQLDGMTPPMPEAEMEPTESTESGEAGSFIVRAALSYMREHCTEHISLADVADSVYVSQWHLSKLINRHTGQSFFDLIGGMRIEQAKVLLEDPAMRVHAVAEAVGYNDVAHFSKSFKRIVGKTPGEFRAGLMK